MARRFSSRPSAEWRMLFLAFLMVCGLGVLLSKLWVEQVLRGPQWAKKIGGRTQVTVRIPSVRGEIRDRNGVTLVANRANYDVDFYLPDMVRGYRQDNGYVPKNEYTVTSNRGMKKKMKEADVVQIVNERVIPRLQELDLAKDYTSKTLQKHYRTDELVPFTYEEGIDPTTIAKFSEHDVGLPGVEISVKPVRQYVYGALAAHLLGYVGAPLDVNVLPDIRDYSYYQPDVDGKSQIEASMDKYLRGKPGTRILHKNVKGVIEGEERIEPPQPGDNVYLTLDARIQTIAEQALRHPAIGRAAAVVVDPNNGDILAMASVPSFDPNIFIPSISSADWRALSDDESVPLISRAVSGFPPGSTFKIITALAGLRKGIGNNRYNCPGGIQYGDHYFKCWIADKHGQHGTLGLSDAIRVSCDCFFYQYGNAAGIDNIDRIGKILGIGQKYNLGLADEKEGALPGPEWMKMRYPDLRWSPAHTANVSIGQGYVLASPLQMAMAYVAVANGGIAYEPRLIKKVLQPDGKPAIDEDTGQIAVPEQPKIRGDLHSEGLTSQQIEIVRHGLWAVVNDSGGTGGKARIPNLTVAGKTGTAQATDRGKKDYIAWFACFAPYDKPKYVVVVAVQSGKHGGSVAAPVAAHILEQTVAMEQGSYKVELAALTPAHSDHPFAAIDAIDYKNTDKISITEEDAGTHGPGANVDMGGNAAHPNIRPDADARGKVGAKKAAPVAPTPPPADRRNFFQRLFGIKSNPTPRPAPAPPQRGGH